jgi:hypothetical protein
MMTIRYAGRRNRRRALSPVEFFWIIAIIALLLSILLPSLIRAREITKRAVCASNLRGIGQGCKIYANEFRDWYPTHFFEPNPWERGDPGRDHGVRWVGMMGSSDTLRISQDTTDSPRASHPSRSTFLLVTMGVCAMPQFICPSSHDSEDDLRNYGGAARDRGGPTAARPGRDRFDFRGYTSLSYGYQLPFGPVGRPSENLDPRVVTHADKGPYYTAGGPGLPGTRTVRDALSGAAPPSATSADTLLAWPKKSWRPFNSRIHKSEGQNVIYVDGHVEWCTSPLAGADHDNIYTIQRGPSVLDVVTGRVPAESETVGPLTNTDSFIVP